MRAPIDLMRGPDHRRERRSGKDGEDAGEQGPEVVHATRLARPTQAALNSG
jgi:hypothetical protein